MKSRPRLAAGVQVFPGWVAPVVHLDTPTRITNASSTTPYVGAELRDPPARRGAADALAVPSRTGQRLRYRDGTIENIAACAGAAGAGA